MTIMVQVKDEAAAMDRTPEAGKTPGLNLEDFSVGDRFSGGALTVTVESIKAFAREFDPQPFHTDEAAAQATFFGGLAASGWHTAAMTMRLLTEFGPHVAGGLIGGSCEVAWPQPTRPGDVLRVECEILSVTPSRSRPERGTVLMRSETKNQHGDVLQVLTAKLVVPRRK
ncbi:MaoC family dehydratase [Dongia sedimenti]|uniref:MaoC family dehydratase n=1 Tax=Dongia sedimenti TaxID=3064282 RepID=A0ABU0YT19_9PROT|nr:MaoC family dehydratase [Rhodospirillaceae bacterium R-7]